MTKWLIDFDSTLSDTFTHQIELVNMKFGTSYVYNDFTSWASEEVISQDEAAYMWGEEVFLSDDFQLSVKAVPHAIDGAQRLLREGHTLYVVSDRPQRLFDVTKQWLTRHGLGDLELIFTRHVHSLSDQTVATMTKAQIAYLYKLRQVVEDAPHHADSMSKRSYIDRVYLLDKPYNQGIEHEKIERVSSWKEIA